jgi:hypothetical protein
MYAINVSFKDILRIGTADSSFSATWTGPVHDYVHVFLMVFVRSPLSFTSAHFVSFMGPWTSLLHRFPVPQLFLSHWTYVVRRSAFRSRVHGPASLTSPVPSSSVTPQSLNLRRSAVLLPFTGPRKCLAYQSAIPFVHGSSHLCRSPCPAPSVLHRFSVPLSFPGPHILSLTGPWACRDHRFPLPRSFIGSHFPCCSSAPVGARCVYMGVLYVPTSLTSHRIPPSLT